MSYRKIEPRMWDDERFAVLTKDAKLTWLCVLTGPHTTPLPGLSVCGIATLSESMRDGFDTVSEAVKELSGAGLLRFNPTTRVMQVPNAPKYNPCANQRVLKGWFSAWRNVPDCAEKYDHVERLRAAVDASQGWVQLAWGETFGTVKVPDRYRSHTVTDTVSNSVAGATTGAVAGGGVGESASVEAPPVAADPKASPPGAPPSGAPALPSAADLAAKVAAEAARIVAEERARDDAAKRAEADGRKAKRAARKAAAEAAPDTIPLPGTPARRVYDAILRDRVLAPITASPGDFADRVTAPSAYPGVDVVAVVIDAGIWLAGSGRAHEYSDGRSFLTKQFKREAGRVAAQPRVVANAGQTVGVAPPSSPVFVPTPSPIVVTDPAALARIRAMNARKREEDGL